jgi:hypothetical protein
LKAFVAVVRSRNLEGERDGLEKRERAGFGRSVLGVSSETAENVYGRVVRVDLFGK